MRHQSPLKFVIAIASVILTAEILIMYFLSAFTGLSAAAKAILDGIILVLLVSPVLYYYNKKKNGDHYWEHASISSVRNSDGVITHFIKVAEDVTDRKRAEDISKEKNTLQQYLDIAGVVLVVIDADQKVTLINRKGCQVLGYDEEEIVGKNWFDTFIPEAVRDKVRSVFVTLIDGDIEPTEHFENPIMTKAGEERLMAWHNSVLRNENGRIIGTLSSGEDITDRKKAEKEIEKSMAFSESIIGNVPDVIYSAGPDLETTHISPKCEDLYGYSPEEFKEDPDLWRKVIHPDDKSQLMEMLDSIKKGKPYSFDYRIVNRSGEIRWIRDSGASILDSDGRIVRLDGTVSDNTVRKRTEEALQKAHEELEVRVRERTKELSRANAALMQEITVRKSAEEALTHSREELRNLTSHLQSAREEERRCIAREIHDELGQTLTALKMDLSWLKGRLPKAAGELPDKTHSMMELVDDTIHTIRKISTALRPVLLDDLGLTAAIEWQAGEFQKRTGIRCSTDLISDDIPVVPDSALAVYRIFQEALTNIARYAEATRVDVTLKVSDGTLVLHVQDNGKGITENQIADPRSIGLIGMRERARAMGGVIHIHGAQAQGTTITVNIPLGNH